MEKSQAEQQLAQAAFQQHKISMNDLDYIHGANNAFINARQYACMYSKEMLVEELRHLSKLYRFLQEKCDAARAQIEEERNENYQTP